MTYKLPSDLPEFTTELKNKINSKFLYPMHAEGWGNDFNGKILVHVKPDETFNQNLYLLLDLFEDECLSIDFHWDDEPEGWGFAYRGEYTDWKNLLLSDSRESLSDGTFEMEGDLETWLDYKSANYDRVASAQELATEFEY